MAGLSRSSARWDVRVNLRLVSYVGVSLSPSRMLVVVVWLSPGGVRVVLSLLLEVVLPLSVRLSAS